MALRARFGRPSNASTTGRLSVPQLLSRLVRHRSRAAAIGALALVAASAGVALPATALDPTNPGVALVASPDGNGYAVVAADGQRADYGSSAFPARPAVEQELSSVAGAAQAGAGPAGWLALRDGSVVPLGGAPDYGSLAGVRDLAGMAATPTGRGYWLATGGGAVGAFGDAPALGSLDGVAHSGPVVAVTATPSGRGYWLATAAGEVFAFGDAPALGAPITARVQQKPPAPTPAPVVSLLSSGTGRGYLAVAADGTTYRYGDFADPGSLAGTHLTSPVVAAAPFSHGAGVWLLTRDGGVVTLGAPFYGSFADATNPKPASITAPYYRGGTPTVSGAAGGLVAIPCTGADNIVVVNAVLARQVEGLLTAAGRDGIGLCATSSFRNSQQQIALRAAYCTSVYDPKSACSRPVALPGRSRHEQGLAVDFSTTPAGFAWLAGHAPAFGLIHLKAFGPQTELWHYSIDGS